MSTLIKLKQLENTTSGYFVLGNGSGVATWTNPNTIGLSVFNNDSGYITASALSPYLTSATAALTYQPIGTYATASNSMAFTNKTGNISQWTNDSGYITASALSPYLTSATAAATYQPIGSYQPLATNLTSLSGLSYVSSSFVKMTAAGTFALDTTTYLTGLTVGTTTITSGTNTRILYNNSGVVGEYAVTGTGTTAVLATAPSITNLTLGAHSASYPAFTFTAASATISSPVNGSMYYDSALTGVTTYLSNASIAASSWTNGTHTFGIYLDNPVATIPLGIGTVSNSNFGFFTNFGTNIAAFTTTNRFSIGKPNFTSYNLPVSLLELRAQDTTAGNLAFALRNSIDTTTLVSIGNTGIITSTVDLNVNQITSGTSVIKVATLDMTAAQIKAGSQVQIVPAQGAGTYIEVISASYFYTYVSAAYTSTALWLITSGSSDQMLVTPTFLTATANRYGRFIQEAPSSARSNSLVANAALMVSANTTSAVGDTPVKIRVLYRVITP